MNGHPERPPALANRRFIAHAKRLKALGLQQRFEYIYQVNLWGSQQSNSGVGSELAATEQLRQAIPKLSQRFGVQRLLDLPCGDFGWFRHINLEGIEYIGADIVPDLISRNQQLFSSNNQRFLQLDLVEDDLPSADLVLCRDCLVHFSYATIARAVANLKRSGSSYLLTTTFTDLQTNIDIMDADWRPLNLQKPPFNWPQPLEIINEGCFEEDGAYADKSLGLWRISDLA